MLKVPFLLALIFAAASVSADPMSAIAYFEEVAGEVFIVDQGKSQRVSAGDLLEAHHEIRVTAGGMALITLLADNFRPIRLIASESRDKSWSWNGYLNRDTAEPSIGLNVEKTRRIAGVPRNDEIVFAWSLPHDTALAVLPLKLTWGTVPGEGIMATVSLFDDSGNVLEKRSAQDMVELPGGQNIEAGKFYTWKVETTHGETYQGKFTLLDDEILKRIQQRYYAFPDAVVENTVGQLRYKALILIESSLYLEAGKLLKTHLSSHPDDEVARSWLVMLSGMLAQRADKATQ